MQHGTTHESESSPALVGILLGGRGLRMGGVHKGNLRLDGRSILERTLDACRSTFTRAPSTPRIYLVGDTCAYDARGALRLSDDPAGVGPIGGLRALLLEARRLSCRAIALAGDMPYLTPALLQRLAFENLEAPLFAPREGARWQPLFARYEPDMILPEVELALARGETSMQVIFHRLETRAATLDLSESERALLKDWDRPSDVTP